MKAMFTMKHISKSGLSCLLQAAKDSNKKLLSALMSQLHRMFQSNNM